MDEHTANLPTFPCPACVRGVYDLVTRTCHSCGVAIPKLSPSSSQFARSHSRGHGPMHDRVSPFVDYVLTKQDKE